MTEGLVASGLGWSVGDRAVLRGVHLRVPFGDLFGLVGPNGAGKSTAFGLLAGTLDGAGSVALGGSSLDGLDLSARARRGLGYLPQGPCSFRGLRAREQLELLAELRGVASPRRSNTVAGVLDTVGLTERARVRVEALSGGERRRLELAGVLLGGFRVLVLDEPFAAVEPRSVGRLAQALRRVAEAGSAVLLADHARQTLGVCDRAALLVSGAILREGPAQELLRDPVVREAWLGEESGDANVKPMI